MLFILAFLLNFVKLYEIFKKVLTQKIRKSYKTQKEVLRIFKYSRQNDLIILEPISSEQTFTTQVYGKNSDITILGVYIGKFEINK